MKSLSLTSSLLLLCLCFGYTQWVPQANNLLPQNYRVNSLSVVDSNVIWSIAGEVGFTSDDVNHEPIVLKTQDGGITWDTMHIEEIQGRTSIDIHAIDATTAWVTSNSFDSFGGEFGLFKTTDGGETWIEFSNGLSAGVWVEFFNDQNAVIINNSAVSFSSDGGETWTFLGTGDIPAFLSGEFTVLTSGTNSCFSLDKYVWFGTTKGRVFRSDNYGQTWTAADADMGETARITSIAFSDSLNGIAVNSSNIVTEFSQTTDGGVTWTSLSSSPGTSLNNITSIPETNIFVGISNVSNPQFGTRTAFSCDYGMTWDVIDAQIPLNAIEFLSPAIGWATASLIDSDQMAAMYKWDNPIDFFDTEACNFLVSTESPLLPTSLNLKLFPNPAAEHLILSGELLSQIKTIEVRSMTGAILKTHPIENIAGDFILPIQDLPEGMYTIVTIPKNETNRRVFKFVKLN